MIFKGGVGWSLVGSGGGGSGPDPKKKSFNRSMFEVGLQ